ncbi:hypothetical protein NPIL_677521 [Nephila pilipes]|uniref:Uncharacterized protein n=1 Tax=Nephila pilipes TaxID=299642 RepID=A0A8X6TXX4_NEPPI|nr:hypothetical protein NPIL_677521 [Nephila pilipes]
MEYPKETVEDNKKNESESRQLEQICQENTPGDQEGALSLYAMLCGSWNRNVEFRLLNRKINQSVLHIISRWRQNYKYLSFRMSVVTRDGLLHLFEHSLNGHLLKNILKALNLGKTPKTVAEEPTLKSDSMVHLLLQGLQSKDKEMLNTVFHLGGIIWKFKLTQIKVKANISITTENP